LLRQTQYHDPVFIPTGGPWTIPATSTPKRRSPTTG
jgi:hypothetical protein